MALEWTLVTELEPPIGFTVADGAGIEKGTLLKLADPMTASLSNGAGDIIAGIAAEEKISGDGKIKLAVYLRGIFKAQSGANISVGANIMSEGTTPNEIITANAAADAAAIMGHALETTTTGETGLVLLNVGVGGSPES